MNVKGIIFSEFFRYFQNREDYVLCINHLDELKWLPRTEVPGQFEYFPLDKDEFNNLTKKINPLLKESSSEKEQKIRNTVRFYLKNTYENGSESANEDIDQALLDKLKQIRFYYNDPYLQRMHIDKKWLIVGLISIFVLAAVYSFFHLQKTARLLVSTGNMEADVYVDTVLVGKSNHVIELDLTGYHKISVKRNGFIASPPYRKAVLSKDSLTRLDFSLIAKGKEKYGYLKILTNVDEANVFIDDEFLGNLVDYDYIRLLVGEHKIELRKYYYTTEPPFRFVKIRENDTSIVHFNLALPSNAKIKRQASDDLYTLEISSNIPGARIYLNGKETEYTTDHIFTDLKPGKYRVSLKKEGFKFSPKSREIILSPGQRTGSLQFTGERIENQVTLEVIPDDAMLIIDRKIKAKGVFKGPLLIGKHEIAFQVPPGYAEMEPQELIVEAGQPIEKTFHLIPVFNYFVRVTDNGNIEKSGMQMRKGYIEEVRGFKYSSSVGPEVVFDKMLNTYIWKFGFAFPYRNPQGSDAIQVFFSNKFDLKSLQNVKLIVIAGITGEKYPMRMVQKVSWRVVFNNFKLHELQQINAAKAGELVKYVWDVTKLMRFGPNMLEISPTETNNTFIFIKEIRITNQE